MFTNSYHILYVSKDTVIWPQALLNSSHINYKSFCFDVYKMIHRDENIYWTLLYRQITPKRIELFIINHFYLPPPHNHWYLVSWLVLKFNSLVLTYEACLKKVCQVGAWSPSPASGTLPALWRLVLGWFPSHQAEQLFHYPSVD